MALIDHLITSSDPRRKRVRCIVGEPGIGKTTLAAHFPNPLFIRTEDGLEDVRTDVAIVDPDKTILSLPICTKYSGVLKCIDLLLEEGETGIETLVIDAADGVVDLIITAICEEKGIDTLGNYPGKWGEGDLAVAREVRSFMKRIIDVRDAGYEVVLLAHSEVRNITNPDGSVYMQYKPQVPEKSTEVIIQECDDVLYAVKKTITKAVKGSDTKRAATATTRILACLPECGYARAKCRLPGMPKEIELDKNNLPQIAQQLCGKGN